VVVKWLRDAPWITPGRVSIYPKLFVAIYAISFVVWIAARHGMVDPKGTPIGVDFVNSWAGSHLALSGHPQDVYSFSKIHAAERAAVNAPQVSIFGWYYPPTFLLVVLPLALLPYLWALAAWLVTTGTAYLWVLRKIAPCKQTLWLALAFPGAWINFLNGQNGFLSAALLGGGLAYLPERPVIAGTLFGLLVFKPQLGIFVPLVLLVARQWRCMLAGAASALGLMGLSLLLFGPNTWRTFFHSMSLPRILVLDQGLIPYCYQQSVFAAMRLWNVPLQASYAIQAVTAMSAAAVLVWLWMGNCSYRLKAAAVVICGLLATPYLFDYDLTTLGIAIAFLALEGMERGFLPYEKSTLALAWLAPVLERRVAGDSGIPLCALINIALLALIAVRATRSESAEITAAAGIRREAPT